MTQSLLLIAAFVVGGAFTLFFERLGKDGLISLKIWKVLYKYVSVYLLVVIGFEGGAKLASEELLGILLPTTIAVAVASFLAIFVYQFFKSTNFFDDISGISIATHFGSVSLGTFVTGASFLQALGIPYRPSAAVWLAVIEFSSILMGMYLFKAKLETIKAILIKDKALTFLPFAIAFGYVFGGIAEYKIIDLLIHDIFRWILLLFLFLMGKSAVENLYHLKKDSRKILFFGIAIPVVISVTASSFGILLGYSEGDVFMFTLLAASCSTVVAPLSVKEILNSMYTDRVSEANRALFTSLVMSIGVTLPFNIVLGFRLFLYEYRLISQYRPLIYLGLTLPIAILIWARYFQSSLKNTPIKKRI